MSDKKYISEFPNLMNEWHSTKNGELSPNEITKGSQRKVWWQCSKGHEWQASIASRSTGRGCPYCSNNKVLVGFNDLETTHPFLVSEWNYEKNRSLYPNAVLAGSSKKVWWKCKNGHEWETTISHRAVRRQGCPFCSGRQAVSGKTDLATLNPELAKEWHPTKNGELKPNQVTIRSGKKIWWLCSKGHEWQATPHDRDMDKTNCPFCSARRQTSFPEQAIFYYVKQIFPDSINRYKDIFVNSMELDIFIPSLSIGIEYDGINWHRTTEEHNREKKKYKICKKNEITLIRIKENKQNTWTDVADKILYVEKRRNYVKLNKLISNLFDFVLEGWNDKISVTIDVERDRHEILGYLTDIENSLEKLRPDVAEEWNYEKNGSLLPSMFSLHSNESVWWKCKKCGHEWKTIINTRIKHGCPLCGNIERGKAFHHAYISVNGTLAENNPELAQEWHTSKNKSLTPYDITVSSPIKVWWKCKKCGHEWQSSPNNRSKGVGCPCCSGRVPQIGVNDLATVNPTLAKEWHPTKNAPLMPNMILPKSGKKVWWKCLKCGHEWQAAPHSRDAGNGCPCCSGRVPKIGVNDFATINPSLAEEWHTTKNAPLFPNMVLPNCSKKVWWKCKKCKHEWQATVSSRFNGRGCPNCHKIKLKTNATKKRERI